MNYSLQIVNDVEQNALLQEKITKANSKRVNLENNKLGKVAFCNEYKNGFVLSDVEILSAKELQIKTTCMTPIFAMYFILNGSLKSSIKKEAAKNFFFKVEITCGLFLTRFLGNQNISKIICFVALELHLILII